MLRTFKWIFFLCRVFPSVIQLAHFSNLHDHRAHSHNALRLTQASVRLISATCGVEVKRNYDSLRLRHGHRINTMTARKSGSRIETEIERCRSEGQWDKIPELVRQLSAKLISIGMWFQSISMLAWSGHVRCLYKCVKLFVSGFIQQNFKLYLSLFMQMSCACV